MILTNFHSHNIQATDAIVSVEPCTAGQVMACNPDVVMSVGIHPWSTAAADDKDLDMLAQVATFPQVVAIGETGLDKLKGGNMECQLEILTRHVELSEQLEKPLILHCVKAWDQLLALKKRMKPRLPWGIHGFRGGPALARQLACNGFYLSLGEHFNPEAARVIPPERLLVETDMSVMPIAMIAQRVRSRLDGKDFEPGQSLARFLEKNHIS
ncbi:MAG: TatD family hydrolase [Clostridiales bacterium]|nr:TatD family hydrolase [Clostridiales bacterium]